jgi:hypothetical protein
MSYKGLFRISALSISVRVRALSKNGSGLSNVRTEPSIPRIMKWRQSWMDGRRQSGPQEGPEKITCGDFPSSGKAAARKRKDCHLAQAICPMVAKSVLIAVQSALRT